MTVYLVVPRAGTWIETFDPLRYAGAGLSFPVRERGLKRLGFYLQAQRLLVVPRAGTWIETCVPACSPELTAVVPRAGTWIETMIGLYPADMSWSFPVRERGLKPLHTHTILCIFGRSPCGNVD